MAVHPLSPRVIYGPGNTTILFKLPQKPWSPISHGIGGADISAAGVPAAWEQRREQRVKVNLMFFESEWTALESWLKYAQKGNSFSWAFNPNDATSVYICYLTKPLMNEAIEPTRSADFIGVYTLELELRSTTGAVFNYAITGY